MTIPDYYGILGVPPTASQEAIKKAYQRESLRSHPDRFPNATPEETHAHTQRFQSVADAYYMLSDPARRAEYDSMRTQQGYASSADDASTQDESARFFRMFGRGGPSEQPQAQGLFADVWEEMLRPEVEHHTPFWGASGTVAGFVLGYILANWPGALGGATIGNRLGAVRDAKGQSVSEVFLRMSSSERARILRALAVKVLGSFS
ncbi:Similar to S.cerevisiae protein CAJ1 (Nuclear type II J heat shock protein of the E. coli dnaJ family) [Malassezia sympodialis ATCC 42132]|uniref:Similar to S.cerevisiae protein CAJ1 (Nuclear type II J heat shock protein of the E. coli dnaJ family) n=1 Tax=Malassezia sympodialis (strain ATCC 42132) TaxID=1230383 RepID=A0A1M8A5T9_MALS4|nr:Similar to S.cerevisiae protein CAJ1 (Nuclear type II J heat shock protein of the E. coli dnaJ family) [Malassezia sympodialis ATCC 42132]